MAGLSERIGREAIIRRVNEGLASGNLYTVLGVVSTATQSDLKRAWKNSILILHPDRASPAQKKETDEAFKTVTNAYESLKDPAVRQAYDQELAKSRAHQSTTSAFNPYNSAPPKPSPKQPFHVPPPSAFKPYAPKAPPIDPLYKPFYSNITRTYDEEKGLEAAIRLAEQRLEQHKYPYGIVPPWYMRRSGANQKDWERWARLSQSFYSGVGASNGGYSNKTEETLRAADEAARSMEAARLEREKLDKAKREMERAERERLEAQRRAEDQARRQAQADAKAAQDAADKAERAHKDEAARAVKAVDDEKKAEERRKKRANDSIVAEEKRAEKLREDAEKEERRKKDLAEQKLLNKYFVQKFSLTDYKENAGKDTPAPSRPFKRKELAPETPNNPKEAARRGTAASDSAKEKTATLSKRIESSGRRHLQEEPKRRGLFWSNREAYSPRTSRQKEPLPLKPLKESKIAKAVQPKESFFKKIAKEVPVRGQKPFPLGLEKSAQDYPESNGHGKRNKKELEAVEILNDLAMNPQKRKPAMSQEEAKRVEAVAKKIIENDKKDAARLKQLEAKVIEDSEREQEETAQMYQNEVLSKRYINPSSRTSSSKSPGRTSLAEDTAMEDASRAEYFEPPAERPTWAFPAPAARPPHSTTAVTFSHALGNRSHREEKSKKVSGNRPQRENHTTKDSPHTRRTQKNYAGRNRRGRPKGQREG
jgi:curved DNA-binding protein CbpA